MASRRRFRQSDSPGSAFSGVRAILFDTNNARESGSGSLKNGKDGLTIARAAVDAAANKKAEDIVLLDVQSITSMADFFVICTADTDRQMKAVLEGIEQDLRGVGARPLHVEGEQDSGWVLADYGDVICHVFKPAEREFYKLEELWEGAKTLVRVQ